ncbi:hypothetical protein SUGI_0683350 [Cryptomeria japonica]|uniref:putative anthocyanidin reductase n=1 Tax=Cryptomeria japonica TaxID=3369 RepID=UPI0024149F95|nr:putative anthocyanidin reductase [Cryptomeria japonica]GLJ33975.1 hypothetical protein SUGI_0683350 [Cryptomeria japonica]
MTNEGMNSGSVVCVTGAGGYIGSWLLKNLLQNGYTVHATLRDIGDEKKCRPLLDLTGAHERLKLFQADLLQEGSFDSAVEGCQGVFHVANPVPPGNECSLEDFIVTSVNGVLNVMRACTRAKSVRRMVLTSSLSTACPMNDKGELACPCIDESCWSDVDILGSQTNKAAWYGASKTLEEQEALKYGAENKLEVVTLLPSLVLGPWFTNIPGYTSLQTIIALIGENDLLYEQLKSIQSMTGSIAIVHIDDICNAHIFLMEHPDAQARYICSGDSRSINSLKQLLSKQLNVSIKLDDEEPVNRDVPISSKKLLDMGFCYKYSLEQTLEESVRCAIKNGFLKL